MKKRIFAAILSIALLVPALSINAFANYVWHDSGSTVLYHNGTPTISIERVFLVDTPIVFSRALVEGWINTGVSQWNSTTNAIPVRFQSGTGSTIQVYAGRPDTLVNGCAVSISATPKETDEPLASVKEILMSAYNSKVRTS